MARRHQAGAVKQGGSFKGRQFTAEVILWAVRWYLMFPISYRDLELMLADRGVEVDHTTIFRWIQAYAPELEKRIRPHLRPSNGSWRVDETYVKVKGRWTYLYRAVDSLWIPIQGGQVFQADGGHPTDLMAATLPI
jgi:IS6 family transposase